MRDYVEIQRLPFRRETLVRSTIRSPSGTCDECGQRRHTGRLYQYGYLADGSDYPTWTSAIFCGARCWRAYHGRRKGE